MLSFTTKKHRIRVRAHFKLFHDPNVRRTHEWIKIHVVESIRRSHSMCCILLRKQLKVYLMWKVLFFTIPVVIPPTAAISISWLMCTCIGEFAPFSVHCSYFSWIIESIISFVPAMHDEWRTLCWLLSACDIEKKRRESWDFASSRMEINEILRMESQRK